MDYYSGVLKELFLGQKIKFAGWLVAESHRQPATVYSVPNVLLILSWAAKLLSVNNLCFVAVVELPACLCYYVRLTIPFPRALSCILTLTLLLPPGRKTFASHVFCFARVFQDVSNPCMSQRAGFCLRSLKSITLGFRATRSSNVHNQMSWQCGSRIQQNYGSLQMFMSVWAQLESLLPSLHSA